MNEFTNVFNELFSLLPDNIELYLALTAYVMTHVIKYLPVEFTTKIPNIVMVFINAIASKHGEEKSLLTDRKGNANAKRKDD